MNKRSSLSLVINLLLTVVAVAQYPNIRVSDSTSMAPEEVTIAINPTNEMNLVAGSNVRYYYFSYDGGLSWSQGLLPPGTYGDPCVLFDANGRAYYGHLADMRSFGGYWIDRLTVHRSSDGGATWYDSLTTPVNLPKQQDKDWLACDLTNSPHRNNVYMAWTEFDFYNSKSTLDSTRILFSRIVDGTDFWTSPIRISDEGGNCLDGDSTVEGAVPAVGPDGEVYLSWAGPKGILFDRSFDGGATFGKDIPVVTMPGGWNYTIPGISPCNGLPMTACDVSNSPYRGTVYILWADQRSGEDNTDVFIVKSTNQGLEWSSPTRVNTDLGVAQQFFPSIAIDQSNGHIHVVYYDRRNYAPSDSLTDVFLATSTDGGSTWIDRKISQTPFLPTPHVFFGDYIHIAARNGTIHPIWMRLDTTKLSVWTSVISDVADVVQRDDLGLPGGFHLAQNYPNPFNPATTIAFSLPRKAFVSLRIFDALGREVSCLVSGELNAGTYSQQWDADGLPSGVYFYRLQAGTLTEVKKLLLLR
jgi:hypothetical protein